MVWEDADDCIPRIEGFKCSQLLSISARLCLAEEDSDFSGDEIMTTTARRGTGAGYDSVGYAEKLDNT